MVAAVRRIAAEEDRAPGRVHDQDIVNGKTGGIDVFVERDGHRGERPCHFTGRRLGYDARTEDIDVGDADVIQRHGAVGVITAADELEVDVAVHGDSCRRNRRVQIKRIVRVATDNTGVDRVR